MGGLAELEIWGWIWHRSVHWRFVLLTFVCWLWVMDFQCTRPCIAGAGSSGAIERGLAQGMVTYFPFLICAMLPTIFLAHSCSRKMPQ